jgi:hypothetical protein
MNIIHLTDDELDRALVGEAMPAPAAEHLAACVACRRRRDGFLAAVEAARGSDPNETVRARVRGRALAAVAATAPRLWVRWALAAAAAVVLGLLPLLRTRVTPPPRLNADRVLVEVDRVLDRDPLEAMAAADVVDAVVPVPQASTERSTS